MSAQHAALPLAGTGLHRPTIRAPAFTPRHSSSTVQKAQQLAQLGIPQAERVLLPHIVDVTKSLYAGLSWSGAGREVREECCLCALPAAAAA